MSRLKRHVHFKYKEWKTFEKKHIYKNHMQLKGITLFLWGCLQKAKTIQKQIMWIMMCSIPETNHKTRVVCLQAKKGMIGNILSPFPPSTACPKALANPWLLEVGAGSCDVKCWLFLVAGGDVSSFFQDFTNKFPISRNSPHDREIRQLKGAFT